MPGADVTHAAWRVRTALAVTVASNLALLVRGPGRSLGPTLLLILAAGTGLGWLLWEQRDRVLLSRRIVLAFSGGLLVVAVLAPPTESHDVWSYVMIGRTVAVHHTSPYEHPSSAFRTDPFRLKVDPVWRHTRSVYGPVFVAMAAGVVKLAGDSPLRARILFQSLAGLAVALSLLLLDRMTRGDPRVLAFIGLNQLVVVTTVNNAHNDAIVGLAALYAVMLVRRKPAIAGLILALAALIKVAALLPAGVLALWLYRDRREAMGAGGPPSHTRRTRPEGRGGASKQSARRAAAALAATAGGVTVVGYAAAGSASIVVLSAARERMNRGSLWFPMREVLVHMQLGDGASGRAFRHAREVTGARLSTISTLAVLSLAILIATRARRDAPVIVAAAVLAYTVLGAYILPWYIVWGLPVLALVWRTRMAILAVGLSFVLELAYVPDGRRIGVMREPQLHSFLQRAQFDTRLYLVPLLELTAVVALVVWSARRAGRIELNVGAPGTGADSPPRHQGQRLEDGGAGQLRTSGDPVGEDDRHLSDRGVDGVGPVHGLDLEGVAVGSRVMELGVADEVSAIRPEAGGVVSDVAADGDPDVPVGPSGKSPPPLGPARLD
jgi:alpha-1,6-mannosyltransferase